MVLQKMPISIINDVICDRVSAIDVYDMITQSLELFRKIFKKYFRMKNLNFLYFNFTKIILL